MRAHRLLAAGFLLAACRGLSPTADSSLAPAAASSTSVPSAGPVARKLVCWGPHSGDLAYLGKAALEACRMAVDEFNASARGIRGMRVQAAAVDDAGTSERAAAMARQLAGDPSVIGIVGPMNAGPALVAGPILDAAHVAFISPSAGHPRITESGWKAAHRVVARDDLVGPAAAVFLFGPPVNATHVYVLVSKDLDGLSLADEFQKRARSLGMKTERDTATLEATDFAATIAKVGSANPAALFVPWPVPRCTLLLQEIRRQRATFKTMVTAGCRDREQLILRSDGAAEETFVADAQPAYDGTLEGQAWASRFKARTGSDPAPFSAAAFDADRVLLQAARGVAETTGNLPGAADVNVEIGAMKAFPGLPGPMAFNGKGDLQKAAGSIYQVSGGAFREMQAVPVGT